ncbi:Nuclear regulatory subunit of Glc7p type 1 protein serine-threonine phosphatase [Phytophthora palmivora]|uniref:Nuclear regulatory subunit of Glc7p type 1 protein serine-threonine phosphatase n=1 Tax=Phytophthora palmivora TaxID=4796 RepID=A0A2P4Y8S0_9STRA|nr:Nuclear regulatory subunit of Glc7p type 1 protein serine-threonine phosphatase [Phytophthora palmivora]
MLGGIFYKRKKNQELRSPTLQDIKKFRDVYAKYAELRQVETPPCFEKSIYKAIAGQKEIHTLEFRQEDITDPQIIALAEALLEIPIVALLDLRDNRITDDGAKALLEVLRQQIIAAKTPPTIDPRTKQPLYPPLPEYSRYVTNVNLKGNEVSTPVLQELSQYMDVLRREDKRLEIRAALKQIDRNSDGGIDEEEFKGVLKLLTTSTPTKKEIRAFMQQHTLSTDSTQNAVNLENVILAKCAVSPSRHSACPPWESLVQERHAILGAPRMMTSTKFTTPGSPDPSPSKTHSSRPSLSSSDNGMTPGSNPFSEVSPLPSPLSQTAPVAPIEVMSSTAKPPPVPVVNTTAGHLQQSQSIPQVYESKSAAFSSDQPRKSPQIPILALASVTQNTITPRPHSSRSSTDDNRNRAKLPVNLSPRSSRSTVDDEGRRNPNLTGPSSVISAPASPHDSDFSENMNVVSSAFGGSISQRVLEDHDHNNGMDRRMQKAATINPASQSLDSPRWPSEHFSVEDGEEAGKLSAAREEKDKSSTGDVDDGACSAVSHRPPKSTTTRSSSNEFNGEVEECVESLVFDVTKDGKERVVAKLLHHEFRSGLTVKDFPVELSFRNLLALLVPENGLIDLALFAECRFPFVTVLDLSRNKLAKLPEEGLTVFPRLEVLNLADNRIKAITGLIKTSKLRALSLSHNFIRSVRNIEHLEHLEILQLSHNQIATVHALRLLSLNKMLTHLNLDGNPVVETDERQKRKNIVHVRNLLPALQSLGSIPCAGMYLKDKKKANVNVNLGKCLLESEVMPEYKKLWVANACDILHILQDATSSSQSQNDDDEWDTRDEDGEDRPKKPLTREQQRQKDELRSRAIGFRSRGKAIPSPPKVKTSVFSFGPPQPPAKKKKKKPTLADPSVVREQQRRASELSAPKYTPVDQTLMQQQHKRKSRVDFHSAMTVGERLQLAQDLTQRRPTATIGLSARSRSILAKADSRKRASAMTITEENSGPDENPKDVSRSPSPERPSPIKDAVVFRIDPADTPRSPKGVLSFRVDPYPAGLGEQTSTPKSNSSKEAGFLHDLAVSDFLNHAEEEFSTALTAMNVLLSMSEKEQCDRNKLAGYRASLEALDILNENESHELYEKTQGDPEHELQTQCTEWFTKLGVVKKCMRQLLEKLELHAPGSGVIRAYCRHIRSNELRGIITTMLEAQEDALCQINAAENMDVDVKKEHGSTERDESLDEVVEAVEIDEGEGHDQTSLEKTGEEAPDKIQGTTTQNEDYDWLATSTELDAQTTDADPFEQEIIDVPENTVSDDEADNEVIQEQTEAGHDYDWSNLETTEPTIEEGIEGSEEVYDNETYDTENINEAGEAEENGNYNEETEVTTEENELTEAQYELGEGVDADDEEAETFGDWEKGFDPNSNHYFWFNHSTGESSWTPPEGWPHEVDEPFSAEVEADVGEDQQEQKYTDETAEAQEYEDTSGEEQQYEEPTTDDQWYDETAAEDQEYATEDQNYEAVEGEQQVEETGEESPRRSEVSDFEFDDSDLPGF